MNHEVSIICLMRYLNFWVCLWECFQISIWTSRLSKTDCPLQCEEASFNLLRASVEQKGGGRWNSLSLSDYGARTSIFCLWIKIHNICTPGSQASDWNVYLWHPMAQAFGLELKYTTSFPGSSSCRQQITELLSHHNCVSWSLIINLFK